MLACHLVNTRRPATSSLFCAVQFLLCRFLKRWRSFFLEKTLFPHRIFFPTFNVFWLFVNSSENGPKTFLTSKTNWYKLCSKFATFGNFEQNSSFFSKNPSFFSKKTQILKALEKIVFSVSAKPINFSSLAILAILPIVGISGESRFCGYFGQFEILAIVAFLAKLTISAKKNHVDTSERKSFLARAQLTNIG